MLLGILLEDISKLPYLQGIEKGITREQGGAIQKAISLGHSPLIYSPYVSGMYGRMKVLLKANEMMSVTTSFSFRVRRGSKEERE